MSFDCNEPPHVHVEREGMRAKFWLGPVRLADSGGFGRIEIRRLRSFVESHAEFFSRRWNGFFGE